MCRTSSLLAPRIPILDRIYVSPFARTIETATCVTTCKKFATTPLEITCDLAETRSISRNNYQNTTIPIKLTQLLAQAGIMYPEPDAHIYERCAHVIKDLTTREFSNILLMSHDGTLEIISSLLGHTCSFGYCDVACFEFRDNKWKYVS